MCQKEAERGQCSQVNKPSPSQRWLGSGGNWPRSPGNNLKQAILGVGRLLSPQSQPKRCLLGGCEIGRLA